MTLALGRSRPPRPHGLDSGPQWSWTRSRADCNADEEKTLAEQREALKKRTAEYEKEYADHKQQLIDLRREAKLGGNFFVEPEAKLLFVIRIVGILWACRGSQMRPANARKFQDPERRRARLGEGFPRRSGLDASHRS